MTGGINGNTAVFGVIGDPIAHTLSPAIHNAFARETGENLVYVPFHVVNEGLLEAIRGAYALEIPGLNVTIPHKKAVIPALCGLDETARKTGAVNTLKRTAEGYVGYNTDVFGIMRTFERMGVSMAGKAVCILGAGGSAYAACTAAALSGARDIAILNRTAENAQALAAHIQRGFGVKAQALGYGAKDVPRDVVIQTTSVGFGVQAGQSPVLPDFFEGVSAALDIVYTPWETAFLRDARANGILAENGFPMLIYQAAAAYEIWLDTKLPTALVERVLYYSQLNWETK